MERGAQYCTHIFCGHLQALLLAATHIPYELAQNRERANAVTEDHAMASTQSPQQLHRMTHLVLLTHPFASDPARLVHAACRDHAAQLQPPQRWFNMRVLVSVAERRWGKLSRLLQSRTRGGTPIAAALHSLHGLLFPQRMQQQSSMAACLTD